MTKDDLIEAENPKREEIISPEPAGMGKNILSESNSESKWDSDDSSSMNGSFSNLNKPGTKIVSEAENSDWDESEIEKNDAPKLDLGGKFSYLFKIWLNGYHYVSIKARNFLKKYLHFIILCACRRLFDRVKNFMGLLKLISKISFLSFENLHKITFINKKEEI